MATGKVLYGSVLKRKRWMREGILQSAHTSFWSPFTGNSKESIVYQENNISAKEGHTVVFDFDGNLSGTPIKGRDRAYGKGEEKRKFSTKITVDRYRLVVDNGDEFDGVDIGSIDLNSHADSRSKLGDLFQRTKDQALFDSAQGLLGQNPTHIIDTGEEFTYNTLLSISKTLKTSQGFSTGGIRAPLKPYVMKDGSPMWIMVLDASQANLLKSSSGYQSLVYQADVRGNGNRAIKGVIGKIGNLMVVEANNHFGKTRGSIALNTTGTEISGLRQKDGNGVWTGQEDFSYSGELHSRGLILGQCALQMAFGKQPDYKFQSSTDFSITSESAVEYWFNVQKTILSAEDEDYNEALVAGIDYGMVVIDTKVAT